MTLNALIITSSVVDFNTKNKIKLENGKNIDRSINEEEVINNTFEERDENVDRVVSYISKCSEETEDDTSISKAFFISLDDIYFVH